MNSLSTFKNTVLFALMCGIAGIFSCESTNSADSRTDSEPEKLVDQWQIEPVFGHWLDSLQLDGAILIYDSGNRTYHTNDSAKSLVGQLPASTFKIPNSMIALESGVATSDTMLIPWDGQDRMFDSWEADMTLRQAYRRSCLPCYQDLVRQMGSKIIRKYLTQFDYPGMRFDSTDYDQFWVQGDSRINPVEQIGFLRRFNNRELNISTRTDSLMREIMRIDEFRGQAVWAKTGWSIQDDQNNGWYVGFLEGEKGPVYFAVNISPKEGFDMGQFSWRRISLAKIGLTHLLD
ncbi:MAG: penicillin-binding transpeptidase domain-containing protein [Bacteroidota bacterium]